MAWDITPARVAGAAPQPLLLILTARVGGARLDFKGTALDPLQFMRPASAADMPGS